MKAAEEIARLTTRRPGSSRLAGLGFEMAAAVAGLSLFGYWLGDHYGHGVLGLLSGAVLGVVGSMYNLIRATLVTSEKGAERARKSERSEDL